MWASPGADVAAVSPVRVQMRQGCAQSSRGPAEVSEPGPPTRTRRSSNAHAELRDDVGQKDGVRRGVQRPHAAVEFVVGDDPHAHLRRGTDHCKEAWRVAHIPTGGLAVGVRWLRLAAPAQSAHAACQHALCARQRAWAATAWMAAMRLGRRRRAMAKARARARGGRQTRRRARRGAPTRCRARSGARAAACGAARRSSARSFMGSRRKTGGPEGRRERERQGRGEERRGNALGTGSASSAQSYERRGAKPRAACRMIPRSRSRVEVESAARAHAVAQRRGTTAARLSADARARMRGRPAGPRAG
jgi:hypothetical protein